MPISRQEGARHRPGMSHAKSDQRTSCGTDDRPNRNRLRWPEEQNGQRNGRKQTRPERCKPACHRQGHEPVVADSQSQNEPGKRQRDNEDVEHRPGAEFLLPEQGPYLDCAGGGHCPKQQARILPQVLVHSVDWSGRGAVYKRQMRYVPNHASIFGFPPLGPAPPPRTAFLRLFALGTFAVGALAVGALAVGTHAVRAREASALRHCAAAVDGPSQAGSVRWRAGSLQESRHQHHGVLHHAARAAPEHAVVRVVHEEHDASRAHLHGAGKRVPGELL